MAIAIAPGVAHGLKLRHDHGSNYMSRDFQDEIECLGIAASPSFVREPEGNGGAERFIRTLKENLLWVRVEPPRVCRRPQLLRGWGHGNEQEAVEQIFT
jgi:putative transposase